jgi:hypothetical protein
VGILSSFSIIDRRLNITRTKSVVSSPALFTIVFPKWSHRVADTKPSGRAVIEGADAVVAQEVAHVEKKGVLNLLPRWISRLKWLSETHEAVDALLVFVEPGRISIRDPAEAKRIRNQYAELAANPSSDDLELLRLIQDRYGILHIPKSKRASLGDPALLHLSIQRGLKTALYVAIYPTSIELMSVAYRNRHLPEFHSELSDLPYPNEEGQ